MSRTSTIAWVLVAGSTAPAAIAQTPTPAPVPVTTLLERLDAAFARGDATAYFDSFASEGADGLARQQRQRQLANVFAASTTRQRSSTVVGAPHRIGDHVVVRARYTMSLQCAAGPAPQQVEFREDCLLALRSDGGGGWLPVLEVETRPADGGARVVPFRCPPCNYEVGGVEGWLCVPLRGDRANALEAVSFYRLDHDVVVDVSVQVDDDERDPAAVATEFAAAMQRLEPTAVKGAGAPWLPPAHADKPPHGLRGARLAVERAVGPEVVIHVAAFGGLQHVLLVRGRDSAQPGMQAAVAALLASHRLLDPDRDRAQAATEALRHHTGGELHGGHYENQRFHVACAGEPGWTAQQRTGGSAFRVVWTSPAGSRFWLTGYAVPPGMNRWCRATADRWLTELCAQLTLDVVEDAPGCEAWDVDPACGTSSRLAKRQRRDAAGRAAPTRWVRLLLYDDLLLVLDGAAAMAADEGVVRRLLFAVNRRQ